MLKDDTGAVILLGMYNQLPSDVSGPASRELAEKMFPKGTKLCIAEPFLKNIQGWKSWCACRQSRRSPRGKKFGWSWLLGPHCCEGAWQPVCSVQAAADEYWQGLRSNAGEVAVLLSNRAQAQMKQQKWVDAMRDAAAALLLSPEDAKAWNRYSSALSGFGDEQFVTLQHWLRFLPQVRLWQHSATCHSAGCAQECFMMRLLQLQPASGCSPRPKHSIVAQLLLHCLESLLLQTTCSPCPPNARHHMRIRSSSRNVRLCAAASCTPSN